MLNPTAGNQGVYNKRRKARKTVAVYKVRLDRPSQQALDYIMDVLSGTLAQDVVTTAMATRRALKVYASLIQRYQGGAAFLTGEMLGIRVNSAIPSTMPQDLSTEPA